MRLITAQNSCYYKCDAVRKEGKEEPGKYKTLNDVKTAMAKQIHADIELKKKAPLTGAFKAIEKKEKAIKEVKRIEPFVEGIKEALQAPKPVIPPPAPPVAGAGMSDAMSMEAEDMKEKNNIVKTVMKNKSKSIIDKIKAKERNKDRLMGKSRTVKGKGVKEI